MNFDKFAASFQNPKQEDKAECEEEQKDVVLIGMVESVTRDVCCIGINGVQYEIASSDVIDIDDDLQKGASDDAGDGSQTKGAAKSKASAAKSGPRMALITVKGNSVLHQKVFVSASQLACMGTWVNVLPPVEAAPKNA